MPRKKPFSGKQKKQQLQQKKDKKQHQASRDDFDVDDYFAKNPVSGGGHSSLDNAVGSENSGPGAEVLLSSILPDDGFRGKFVQTARSRKNDGRYALIFRTETKEEVLKLKQEAKNEICHVQPEYMECSVEDFYPPELNFPIRPPWRMGISRTELERNENKYFNEYLYQIETQFEPSDLSYFELNLETWRQLWRVLEMCDILLCVVDIRFPPLLFPPKLYEYVKNQLGKSIIVILNKIDLCPAHLVLAWKDYFMQRYPDLEIICFTSFPIYNMHGNTDEGGVMKRRKRRGKMKMAAEGAMELYKACEKLVGSEVNLSSWKAKIEEELQAPDEEETEQAEVGSVETVKQDTGFYEFKRFKDGILTIGCVGQPNTGKSSLINALKGRKVVSVSKTPGHTKHFQTIFLTPNVRLCDCPGLVFPSRVTKPLQVLCGSYPIAQLREPYSVIKYMAERINLPQILKISHPENSNKWNAYDIADGWAEKRGYITAKAARLDTYRGANHILRLALEGRIRICLRPPNFTEQEERWKIDDRVPEIERIQAKVNPPLSLFNEELNEFQELSDEEPHMSESHSDSGDESDDSHEDGIHVQNKFNLLDLN